MEDLLRRCHIGMELSEYNLKREYSLSFRSIEYLRCGLPVVCNDYLELAGHVRDYAAGWAVEPARSASSTRLHRRQSGGLWSSFGRSHPPGEGSLLLPRVHPSTTPVSPATRRTHASAITARRVGRTIYSHQLNMREQSLSVQECLRQVDELQARLEALRAAWATYRANWTWNSAAWATYRMNWTRSSMHWRWPRRAIRRFLRAIVGARLPVARLVPHPAVSGVRVARPPSHAAFRARGLAGSQHDPAACGKPGVLRPKSAVPDPPANFRRR